MKYREIMAKKIKLAPSKTFCEQCRTGGHIWYLHHRPCSKYFCRSCIKIHTKTCYFLKIIGVVI